MTMHLGSYLLPMLPYLAAFGMLTLPSPADARIADQPLRRVARSSKAVGIVHVTRIVPVGQWRLAEALVLEPIRGLNAGDEILVIAQPLWKEDVSTAVEGERALLLLCSVQVGPGLDGAARRSLLDEVRARYEPSRRVFAIHHHGRARFPIERNRGDHWVDLSRISGLRLPAELKPARQRLSTLTNYLYRLLGGRPQNT